MITTLDDFLRRRSKIALVLSYDEIEGAKGLHEACRLLFGDDAQKRYDEYFTPERRAEYEALRRPTGTGDSPRTPDADVAEEIRQPTG